jgi:transposase
MWLEQASREQLLAVITQLEATNASLGGLVEQLRARVVELEQRPGGLPAGKSPPAFVKLKRKKADLSKPRKGRSQAFVRRREEPTRTVTHALDHCQTCGTALMGGSVKRTRQVLHVPLAALEVIEHEYVERCCPVCKRRNVPEVELGGQVVGKARLSADTMAMIASLREQVHLPVRKITWLLESFYGLRLSVGQIVRVLDIVATKAAPLVDKIRDKLRASSVLYGDETGWREDGINGFLWSFSNSELHYVVVDRSRASEVVRRVLGEEFAGVLVSDFYGAYNCYEGPHQRCWVHLLRDSHHLQESLPDDEVLEQWTKQVHSLYLEAKEFRERAATLPRAERVEARQGFEERLLALATPYLKADVPQRVLCQRIERFSDELFTFVELPMVAPDNNAAERAIRHQVVARKISAGTRSSKGSATKAALATIFSTWARQALDPFLACRQLLNSP